MMVQMIKVGEETGKLDLTLDDDVEVLHAGSRPDRFQSLFNNRAGADCHFGGWVWDSGFLNHHSDI